MAAIVVETLRLQDTKTTEGTHFSSQAAHFSQFYKICFISKTGYANELGHNFSYLPLGLKCMSIFC